MTAAEPVQYPVCLHCPVRLAIASFANATDREAPEEETTP